MLSAYSVLGSVLGIKDIEISQTESLPSRSSCFIGGDRRLQQWDQCFKRTLSVEIWLWAQQRLGHLGEMQVVKAKLRGWVVFQAATTGGLEQKKNMANGLWPPRGGLAGGMGASVGVRQTTWPFPCLAPYVSPLDSTAHQNSAPQSPSGTFLIEPRSHVKPKLEWNVGNVFQPLYHRNAV